jgi:hypothetical protein
MKEANGILETGNKTIIIDGGNPLNGCPTDWDSAKLWRNNANSMKDDEDEPIWSWDCGYKLDFDGPIIQVSSRFYPPKTHYGPTWDGDVTIYFGKNVIREQKFDCPTLEELRNQVEKYVNDFKNELCTFFNQSI